ncbi:MULTISPECIES: bifunctional DNA primase/polymerase [unclassified Streptomyces]|uniref:bifunctional DNA primase/polymerase n=1 Tax=unclassified Streptomyces TaxID=2593676 RepID=UPI00037CEA82|nr:MULTISPECIES: bifunctional DNA primase/polymerase [unclassified Streptomyces]MYT30554.1 hypothetical protein [Streptomyces sp. SID8354]
MSEWLPETPRNPAFPTTAYVTLAGADWLASTSPHPEGLHRLWAERPTAPSTLPCGTVFDVINAPALFGRRMVDRLWSAGPGSGPVAMHRGRILLFAAPGTAQRLPALLAWEEWGSAVPPLLCHGSGDAVTVPPLHPHAAGGRRGPLTGRGFAALRPGEGYGWTASGAGWPIDVAAGAGEAGATAGPAYGDAPTSAGDPDSAGDPGAPAASRWLVAPDVREPWLPGPEVLLWACVRAARGGLGADRETAREHHELAVQGVDTGPTGG